MSYDLGTAHGKIDLDYEGGRETAKADEDMDRLKKNAKDTDKSFKDFDATLKRFFGVLGTVGKGFALTAVGVSTLVNSMNLLGAAVAGVAALAPVAGAALAVLPGLVASYASVMVIAKVATAGMGDALKAASGDSKKFEEALKKLSPQAQAFAKAWRSALATLKPTQKAIQDAGFQGLAPLLTRVVRGLVSLRAQAVGVAAALNAIVREVMGFLASRTAVEGLRASLSGVNAFLLKIRGNLAPVLAGFLGLAAQGAALGGSFGDSVANALQRLGSFLQGVDLGELFAKAEPIIQSVAGFLKDIGTIAAQVFSIFNVDGANTLGVIGEMASAMAAFLTSMEGQAALQALGQALAVVSGSVGQVFVALLQELGPLIVALAPGFAQLAKDIAGVLVPALALAGPLLTKVAGFMSSNIGTVYALAAAMGVLVGITKIHAAVVAVQAAGGLLKYLKAIKLVQVATKVWAAVQWLLNVALTANPIGLIIVGIAALIAVIVLIATKTDWFQRLWKVVWSAIKVAAKAVADWFVNSVWPMMKAAWEGIVAAFQVAWNVIKAILGFFIGYFKFWWSVIGAIISFLAPAFKAAFGVVVAVIKAAWAVISAIFAVWKTIMGAIFGPILNAIVALFRWAFGIISSVVKANWTIIKTVTMAVWNAISGVLKSIWNGLVVAGKAAWDAIKTAVTAVWDFLKPYVTAAITVVKAAITTGWNVIKTVTSSVWNAIKAVFTATWNTLKSIVRGGVSAVTSIFNGIKAIVDKVRSFFNQLKTAASGGTGSLIAFVKTIPGKVLGAIGNLGSKLYAKGRELVQGFIDGIGSMVSKAIGKVKSLVSAVTDYLPGSPAKKGPLSGHGWTPFRGAALVKGLMDGMVSRYDRLRKMSLRIAHVITPVLPTAVGDPSNSFSTQPVLRPVVGPRILPPGDDPGRPRFFGPYRVELDGRAVAEFVVDTISGNPVAVSKSAKEGDRQTSWTTSR